MTFPELRRAVASPRSDITLAILATAIGAAIGGSLWVSEPVEVHTVAAAPALVVVPAVVVVPVAGPPIVVEKPAPPPAPRRAVATRACPIPRFDAPVIEAPSIDDDFPNVVRVASTNVGWVAVWSSELFVSRDAGASFARVETRDPDSEDDA